MCLALAFAAVAPAQQAQAPKAEANLPPDENQISPDQLPPEEDKAKIQQQYSFNPVQSNKDVTVGEFYFKKGDFKAAAGRFREATKWNDGNAEAWLRLGDAEDKNEGRKGRAGSLEEVSSACPGSEKRRRNSQKTQMIRGAAEAYRTGLTG